MNFFSNNFFFLNNVLAKKQTNKLKLGNGRRRREKETVEIQMAELEASEPYDIRIPPFLINLSLSLDLLFLSVFTDFQDKDRTCYLL